MDQIYTKELIHSYKNPEHKGVLKNYTAKSVANNLSCGDSLTVYFEISKNKIINVSYQGSGCIVSMGSAEVICDYIIGKSINNLKELTKDNYLKLLGFELTPARQKCALIFYDALQNFMINKNMTTNITAKSKQVN